MDTFIIDSSKNKIQIGNNSNLVYMSNCSITNLSGTSVFLTNITSSYSTITNISSTNVSIVNLSASNILNVNLSTVNLLNVNLSTVNLTSTNMSTVNLSSTNTTGVNISNTNLTSTNISNTNLTATNISNVSLTSTKITSTNISNTNLTATNISNVSLTATQITSTNISNTNLTATNISNVNLTATQIISTNISNTNLTSTNISNTNLTATQIISTNISNTNLTATNISNITLTASNISTNGLSVTNATVTNISNINLTATNISTNGLSVTNATVTNISNINLTATNISTNGLSVTNTTATNISNVNLTSSNISTSNLYASTILTSSLAPTNLSATNISTVNLSVTGNTTFTNTPICTSSPEFGYNLTNKAYVDTQSGQSTNGINLYMNPSISYPSDGYFGYDTINNIQLPYYELSSTINYNNMSINNFNINYNTFNVSKVILNNNTNPICAFISPTGFPYVTNIPSGLWIMNLYSYISDTSGSVFYYFSVYKNTTSNLIARSAYSRDVNGNVTSTPFDIYTMILPFPDTPMSVTDRILVTINVSAVNIAPNTTLNSMFEGSSYSFLTTSLNSGTKLLSSNNNWSGQNNFSNVNVLNMVNTNMSNTNLTADNISNTNLTSTNLSSTNISNTILTSVNISTSNLFTSNISFPTVTSTMRISNFSGSMYKNLSYGTTSTITEEYYSDSNASRTVNSTVTVLPRSSGDTTTNNGIYVITAGNIVLRGTSAPMQTNATGYFLYNLASTQYVRIGLVNNSGWFDFNMDASFTSAVTVTTGATVLTSANTYADGEYYVGARQIKLTATKITHIGRGLTINKVSQFGANAMAEYYYVDANAITTLTATVQVEPFTTGDATNNNGKYDLYSGTIRLKANRNLTIEAPYTELYGPIFPKYGYNGGTGTGNNMAIGYMATSANTMVSPYFNFAWDVTVSVASIQVQKPGVYMVFPKAYIYNNGVAIVTREAYILTFSSTANVTTGEIWATTKNNQRYEVEGASFHDILNRFTAVASVEQSNYYINLCINIRWVTPPSSGVQLQCRDASITIVRVA